MSKILPLIVTMIFVTTGTLASSIPLQPIFSDNLIVIPYETAAGEARAEFRYLLDSTQSGFSGSEVSGWLTLDVAQTAQQGNFTNFIHMGFTSLNTTDVFSQAFVNDFPSPLVGVDMYTSAEALMSGQADLHRGQFPVDFYSGNLSFSPLGGFHGSHGEPLFCIECGFDIYLNFLFMDFSTGQLQLNLSDTRTDVFIGQDFFHEFSPYVWDMQLTLQQVPLPAAFWLFLSALSGIVIARRVTD